MSKSNTKGGHHVSADLENSYEMNRVNIIQQESIGYDETCKEVANKVESGNEEKYPSEESTELLGQQPLWQSSDGFDSNSDKTKIPSEEQNKEEKLKIGEDDPGDERTDDDSENLPIDRGYAWIIVAGSFLNILLMVGYGKGIAILFVEYIRIFEASISTTTMFMGVMGGCYSVGALFSMHIVLGMLGVRKTVLLGATLNVIGMATAIFAPSLVFLICTHSILIGVGNSMVHGPGLVLIGHYFKKKRGVAIAVATTGSSLSGIIFPPLVQFLLDTYAIRGTMIILTGLSMNMWVGALLLRPLESFKKRNDNVTSSSAKDRNERKTLLVHLKQAFAHLDFSLFKIRTFQYIACFTPIAALIALNGPYIPALAKEMGVSKTDGALLLTILNSLEFVSRLLVGSVVDRGYMKVYNLMGVGLLLTGAVTQFTMFYDSYRLLIVYSVISGIFGRIYLCLLTVAIVEFMGVDNMAKVIGFVSLFQGAAAFITHPILGSIRDHTGSYTLCFNYIGTCACIGAILLFCAPLVIPKKPKEDKDQQSDV